MFGKGNEEATVSALELPSEAQGGKQDENHKLTQGSIWAITGRNFSKLFFHLKLTGVVGSVSEILYQMSHLRQIPAQIT